VMSVGPSSSSQCSFTDITNFICFFILYSLPRKNLLEFFLMYPGYLLEFKNNVSWKLVRLDL